MPTGKTDVIDGLQASGRMHLTAIEHYVTLAEHVERWGYSKLAGRFLADAEEERQHFKKIAERLEFFDVAPALDHKLPAWPRHDYPGILVASLALENAAAALERANILACREVGDEQSALVFVTLLCGSEESILKIEAAQQVITEIGLDNYLASFL